MFRKILASVLCLMLALAMPLTSLAATDIALKIVPGPELAATDEMVNTIFNNLMLRIVAEDNSGLLALESTSGEIASAAIRADENGIYVASPFLGDRVVYFTMEDLSAFMVEMMRQSGVDEETIAQFEQSLAQVALPAGAQNVTGTSITGMMNVDDLDELTPEQLYANDPAMLQFMENIEKKMVVTQGEFTDPAFNTATTKTEVVMNSEDLMLVFDSEMVKEVYGSMAQSAGMTADELLKMVKDVFSQLDMTYNIVTYTNEDDLCAMQMDMIMKGDVTLETTDTTGKATTETATFDMTMDMDMSVLTTGEVDNMVITTVMNDNASTDAPETIGFDMNIANNDEADTVAFDGKLTEAESTVMLFQGAFAEAEDDAINGWVGILAENEQVTFTINGKENNDVYEALVSVYARGESTAIVEPTWSDSPVISFAVQVKDVATPDLLNKINAAAPETSVQLLKMTEEQLNQEISAISGDAMSALFSGLGNLPAELMQLVMTAIPMQ
ncbi:MAG: hypothetical protein E7323_03550 [Clostridiales bacterium]|nr:hypothetical protein [Clostridiales bacterium]